MNRIQRLHDLNAQNRHRQMGFSLLEVVLTIVILSITMTSLFSILLFLNQQSQYPILQHQAYQIAQNYLAEILAKPAVDPNQPETGGIEPDETYPFDDVQDYKTLHNVPVHDHERHTPTLAKHYRLTMMVTQVTVANQPMWRVDIIVIHQRYPFIQAMLSVYRNVL